MYANRNNGSAGRIPPGLLAYQHQQRELKNKKNNEMQQYEQSESDEEIYEMPKKNMERPKMQPKAQQKNVSKAKKNIDKQFMKKKLDEVQYELLMIEEKKKELKRLFNRLNKEMNY